MTLEEEAVARLYDGPMLDYELTRLDVHWVEFGMTMRALERYVEGRGTAVEIGVGSGAYTSWLAARGFEVHLVDISEKLLEAATARVAQERRSARILGTHLASATDVSALADGTADLVLCMGPLYHLQGHADRRKAVREAFRLLKPGGLLFASGVNRLAYLADTVWRRPEAVQTRKGELLRVLRDGNIDDFGPGSSQVPADQRRAFGHMTTASEFATEFRDGFDQLVLLGLQSFVGIHESSMPEVDQANRDAWLDIIEETAHLPDALGATAHFLYAGRRKARWVD